MSRNFIELNSSQKAFDIFKSLMPGIKDVRGVSIEFDFGSYSHIADDRQILQRIRHIKSTLINPDEIRQSHHKGMQFREIYMSDFYEDEYDLHPEPFLVVADVRVMRRFWTAILPTPGYLNNVKKGKLIWSSPEK